MARGGWLGWIGLDRGVPGLHGPGVSVQHEVGIDTGVIYDLLVRMPVQAALRQFQAFQAKFVVVHFHGSLYKILKPASAKWPNARAPTRVVSIHVLSEGVAIA